MKTNRIILGDALVSLKELSTNTVDCCVTSPPYFHLRDYGEKGQIGLESTVDEYITKLVDIFREVRRVLKSDGTLWLNIADSYAGSTKGAARNPDNALKYKQGTNKGLLGSGLKETPRSGCKQKDLLGIPWILAMALRDDGWYLRQDIIWDKPNCMPESVKDRCTKAHEYLFLLSKSKRYYFDYRSIQEPCVGLDKSSPRGSLGTLKPNAGRRKGNRKTFRGGGAYTNNQAFINNTAAENATHGNISNDAGLRRKRSVWHVATVGSQYHHYATFPPKLIEPCILAGCRDGGIVLDPFAGTGTTGFVAQEHGRNYILIELNSESLEICRKRLLQQEASND